MTTDTVTKKIDQLQLSHGLLFGPKTVSSGELPAAATLIAWLRRAEGFADLKLLESFLPAGISYVGSTDDTSLQDAEKPAEMSASIPCSEKKVFKVTIPINVSDVTADQVTVAGDDITISQPNASTEAFTIELETLPDADPVESVLRLAIQVQAFVAKSPVTPDALTHSKLFTFSDVSQPFVVLVNNATSEPALSKELKQLVPTSVTLQLPEFSTIPTPDFGSLLISPHKTVPHKAKDLYAVIQSDYAYYHYMCDGFDDSGWGCAYRSLQTIWSWLQLKGRARRPPPDHREIQESLVACGDKQANFVDSRGWIGSFEICYVLQNLAGVESRTLSSSSGKEVDEHGRALVYHFQHDGAPVMIGGGSYAHTIIGADYNRRSGECEFLILDPHYTGKDTQAAAVKGGGIVWKTKKFFDPKSHYNLLFVTNP